MQSTAAVLLYLYNVLLLLLACLQATGKQGPPISACMELAEMHSLATCSH